MKPVNFLDPVAMIAELGRAERLWPDPFQAPEVPPRGLLTAFLKGTDMLPLEYRNWLPAQISESVNCQRALEMLRAELNPDHPMHLADSERLGLLRNAWEDFKLRQSTDGGTRPHSSDTPNGSAGLQAGGAGSETAALREFQPSVIRQTQVAIDQLWTTKARLERFSGRQLETRMTWRPVEVLIAEGPFQDMGETFWRAIPCTPLWAWGEENVGAEEAVIRIGGADNYVVHFLLEYPVSESQLHACIGTAEDSEIVPGSARATQRLILERHRLLERAAWLTATLDARREVLEASPARIRTGSSGRNERGLELLEVLGLESLGLDARSASLLSGRGQFRATLTLISTARARIQESIALAAKTPGGISNQALLVHGSPDQLVREISPPAGFRTAAAKSATVLLEPSETTAFSGPAFAQWDVSELVSSLYPARQLIVLSPKLENILATGIVRDGVATCLACDWEQCRKTIHQWEDWVLLIFETA